MKIVITELNKYNTEMIEELEEKFPQVFVNKTVLRDFDDNPYTRYLLYLIDNKIVGFINYYLIYDRIEIVNFNILDFFQNKGYGSILLNHLIDKAKNDGIKNITLEVRKDNEKAIYLYKKNGFIEKAIRKNYYNGIDGILMEKELM